MRHYVLNGSTNVIHTYKGKAYNPDLCNDECKHGYQKKHIIKAFEDSNPCFRFPNCKNAKRLGKFSSPIYAGLIARKRFDLRMYRYCEYCFKRSHDKLTWLLRHIDAVIPHWDRLLP